MDFTLKSINQLTPQVRVKRTTIKGLPIVVEQRSNILVFHFKYKSPVTFRPRHVKLAESNYGKATAKLLTAVKNKASTLNAQVISGIDPLFEIEQEKKSLIAKENSKNTYLQLWDTYHKTEKYQKLSDGSQIVYENKFRKIKDHFGDRDINTITQMERDSFLEGLSPSVRNGIFTIIRQLESIYRKTGVSREQKLDSIERSSEFEYAKVKVRDKILTDDEIRELFKSESTFGLVLQWQLLHGCRISEATGMLWREINFQERTWTIPASRIKTQRKSSVIQKNHVLPLTNLALEFLMKIGNRAPDSLVFINEATGKSVKTDRINVWLKKIKKWDWSTHACRRTVATRLAETVPLSEVKLILNHATDRSDQVTMGYIKSQMLEKKLNCLNVWHYELRKINAIQSKDKEKTA